MFFIIIIILALTGCNSVSKEEIKRITSPDLKVDAVLTQVSGNATTSIIYELYIVKRGASISEGNALLRLDHEDGLIIGWSKPRLLNIRYKTARIYHFTNFWLSKDLDNFKYIVELRLVPQSEFSFLPGEAKH